MVSYAINFSSQAATVFPVTRDGIGSFFFIVLRNDLKFFGYCMVSFYSVAYHVIGFHRIVLLNATDEKHCVFLTFSY